MQGDNSKALGAIADLLRRPEAVIFAGAGLSAWSGLPNWTGLLQKLVEFVEARTGMAQTAARSAVAVGSLAEAAEYLLPSIKQTELSYFLREDSRLAHAQPSLIHRLLVTLGPTCFVTTNFDKLIEQQFAVSNTKALRVVTNRQLADIADIYRADARAFIFKPHGDMDDAASIVLTESAFHRIIVGSNVDGQRSIYKALELLLSTRPVLFVGYSLSDLDLKLILSGLQNAFDRNAGDYWAILPDVPPERQKYLWENFRIRALSYATLPGFSQSSRDHSELLKIVQALHRSNESRSAPRASSDNLLLAIARYGSRLAAATQSASVTTVAYLHQHIHGGYTAPEAQAYHRQPISHVLSQCPSSLVVAGRAGAGKSFSVQQYLAGLGMRLREWGLTSDQDQNAPPVPILLDARSYNGSFARLASTVVPSEILANVAKLNCQTVLVIDSLDEMPSQYLEEVSWSKDLTEFVQQFSNRRIIYCTRRADLVPDRDLPIFELYSQSDEQISSVMKEARISERLLTPDAIELLSTPFMLMIASRYLDPSSKRITASLLFNSFLQDKLKNTKLRTWRLPLIKGLEKVAYDANVYGRDTLQIEIVESTLAKAVGRTFDYRIVDELVSVGLLVSEIDGHVRFVHRSLLEYLAAKKLAEQLIASPSEVTQLLSSRRWDNCFAWSSSFLARQALDATLATVCSLDPCLAIKMARSAEVNRDAILKSVTNILLDTPLTFDEMMKVADEIEETDFPPSAAPVLRKLVGWGNALGGGAASKLVEMGLTRDIRQLSDLICLGKIDYNMANSLSPVLGRHLTGDLLQYFIDSLLRVKIPPTTQNKNGKDIRSAQNLWHGISLTIANLSIADRHRVRDLSSDSSLGLRSILCEALRESKEPADMTFLIQCWEQQIFHAAFWLYLRIRHRDGRDILDYLHFTPARLAIFRRNFLAPPRYRDYSEELLQALCRASTAWDQKVLSASRREQDPSARRLFRLCATKSHRQESRLILQELADTVRVTSKEDLRALELLQEGDLRESTDLVIELLTRDDLGLINALANELSLPWSKLSDSPLAPEQIGRLLKAVVYWCSGGANDRDLRVDRLSMIAIANMTPAARLMVIARANDPLDPDRMVILTEVIGRMDSTMLSTKDLTPESCDLLLRSYVDRTSWTLGSPGQFATEKFIEGTVIPFAQSRVFGPKQQRAIEEILTDAGNRHGRRYIVAWRGGRKFGREYLWAPRSRIATGAST